MAKERPGFRAQLQDILEFSDGRRLLTLQEVRSYTGLKDNRTVKKVVPTTAEHWVSAVALARALTAKEGGNVHL